MCKPISGQDTQTFPADLNGFSQLTNLTTHAYLDGLGRTVQTVGQAQAYNGQDQVSAVAYDSQGRQNKTYETYTSGVSTGAYSSSFGSQLATTISYEASALNRPLTITPPDFGTRQFTYGTNSASFTDANNNPIASNTVYERTVIDGNNNKSRTYTDIQGRKLMDRRMDSAENPSSFIDTKYDYDWRNLLEEVVPPGSTLGHTSLNFNYTRDKEGKIIQKKLPSKDPIDYVYDDRDLLIGYQDGYMRSQTQPWYVYKYDDFGRETNSGFHTSQPTNGNTTPATILTSATYGGTGTGTSKGKVISSTARILGTSNFVEQQFGYDPSGRNHFIDGSNIFQPLVLNDRTDIKFDGASNIIEVKERARLGVSLNDARTATFTTHIDNDGRISAEYIKLNPLPQRQLNQKTYTAKDQVEINYQGGSSSSYLQKMDYVYLANQSLSTVNVGVSTGEEDIFGYRLNYTESTGVDGNTSQGIIARWNGDINSLLWAEDNQTTEYHNYRYDHLNRLLFDYTGGNDFNTSYTYDDRGNFDLVTRKHEGALIDNLDYTPITGNDNQVATITDTGDDSQGYRQVNSSPYEYDNNGNMTVDPQKDITITYNHLDLPEVITFSDGRKIECVYDGSGKMWSKILKDASGNELQRHNYVGSFETINGKPYAVMHSEGRMVNAGLEGTLAYLYLDHQQKAAETFQAGEIQSTGTIIDNHTQYEGVTRLKLSPGFTVDNGAIFTGRIVTAPGYSESWRYEWSIRDHLGNLRINYTGPDRNNLEILQRQSYYPYGMHRAKDLSTTLENKYQFNGIDHVGEFGLDWEMATFRSMDSRMGVWTGVDPRSEELMGSSPYTVNNCNPISFSDPDGDLPFLAVIGIGAATGIFSNGLANVTNGNGFFQGAGSAALWGGIGAAASLGIGAAIGNPGIFGKELGRGLAHGLSTGLQSELSGGSFGQGFLSGGLASGIGSGIGALGGGAGGQIFGGGLGGGIGSAISGGNFFEGMTQGLLVGGFNHALHSAIGGGPGDPPTKKQLKEWLAGEFLNGNISKQDYINAIVLVDDGGWGLLKQVLYNNRGEIALSVVPGGKIVKPFKGVTSKFLAKHGIKDVHAFKEFHLGTNKGLSKFDVVKHTSTQELMIVLKKTQTIVSHTGRFIK